MSDKYKHREERMRDIRRYLDGKMSDRERNSFERKLQGDPFEEEAMGGLSGLSSEEFDKDLSSLRAGLKSRTYRRTSLFYRIAAAVVVLLAISSLLLVRELNKPTMMVSENLAVEEDSIVERAVVSEEVSLKAREPEATENEPGSTATRTIIGEETEIISDDEAIVAGIVLDIVDEQEHGDELETVDSSVSINLTRLETPVMEVLEAEAEAEAEAKKVAEEVQSKNIVSEERKVSAVRSKKVKEAVPQPMAVEQAAEMDTGVVFAEEAGITEDQVMKFQEAEVDPDIIADSGAEPYGGMKEFREYLETDQIFPSGWNESDREIVKLELTVGISGEIEKIEIIKSPDKLFSDEAIRLVEEGPPWFAAVRNSKRVEEIVMVRIVFKR